MMNEEKYVVLCSGVESAYKAQFTEGREKEGCCFINRPSMAICLEAFVKWQSERSPQISPELLESLSTSVNVSKEKVYDIVDMALRRMYLAPEPAFDATLGGALMGRTFTRKQADAMIHIIETSVHGRIVNGFDEATPEDPTDPPIGVQCGQCGGTKGIHYPPCDGKVKRK